MKEETAPPTALRVAAGLWLAIAVFAVLTVVSVWALRGELARKAGVPEDDVTKVLVSLTVVAMIFSALYVLLTTKLYRGRKWARPALSALAVLHMVWLLISGVSAASLITLVLLSVAVVLTWQPGTAQWLAEVGE